MFYYIYIIYRIILNDTLYIIICTIINMDIMDRSFTIKRNKSLKNLREIFKHSFNIKNEIVTVL